MNLIEALKLNRPLRRPGWASIVGEEKSWADSSKFELISLKKEEILAEDWEVRPEIVQINRDEYFNALATWAKEVYSESRFYGSEQVFVDYILDNSVSIWNVIKRTGSLK